MHTNSSFYCYGLTVTAAKGQEAGSASQQGKQGRATALCLWGFTADRLLFCLRCDGNIFLSAAKAGQHQKAEILPKTEFV